MDPLLHYSIAHGSFSAIDLSICSLQLIHKLAWETLPELHDSDHYPIKISIPDIVPETIHLPKRNVKKAN